MECNQPLVGVMTLKKTIYEKIEEKTVETVKKINQEAKLESDKLRASLLNKANKEIEVLNKEALNLKIRTIDQKKALYELERKQALLKIQNNVIQVAFQEALAKLNQLEGAALLEFVYNKLKKEKLTGEEVIEVNSKDYNTFLQALSTKNNADLVDLDLLNAKLGKQFHLKLSHKPGLIDNGFLVIGKDYDLNFSYTELLEVVKKQQEKAISQQLFE